MTSYIEILDQLKKVIGEQLNNYLEDMSSKGILKPIDVENVEIEYPDTDNMRKNVMFFIVPDQIVYEDLTTGSDAVTSNITVYLLCKRDKQENLIKKVLHYSEAFLKLIRNNQSLDGIVEFSKVDTAEFYPYVESEANVSGMEMNLIIQNAFDY